MMGCCKEKTDHSSRSLSTYNYLVLNSTHDVYVLGSDIRIHVRLDDKVRKNNILGW